MDRRAFLKSTGAVTVGGLAVSGAATTSLAGTALNTKARILSLSMPSPRTGLDTSLVARRLAEGLESATDGQLQIIASQTADGADINLEAVPQRVEHHLAWMTFLPLIHGFESRDFGGWLTTGGGAPMLERLEAETSQRVFLVTEAHAPQGLWANRELVGLHPHPSLSVTSSGRTLLSRSESGATILELKLSDGLAEDMEAGRLQGHILHALPTPLAGEPLVMSIPQATWHSLPPSEQAILATLTEAERARTATEAHVSNQLARTALSLPSPVKLPPEFKLILAAAIEAERDRLASSSPLAADILASQVGYRTMTGATDLAVSARHFSV